MKERLQKLLSGRGVCSRRKAEELIQQGKVTVNGIVATLGESADPDVDTVLVDGAPLPTAAAPVYIMLHKPRGFVTTLSDEKGRRDVTQLVDCGTRVYPVGRLDMDSEGLIILTNDGALADRLMHPRAEVDKVYEVWVTGFAEGREKLLERRIELDGYLIRQPKARLLSVKGDQ
ncbi:MAG: rRNA pseudouridine synthase, partial [Oscillospiraceae bacterium]|nr:rRNA pseudouridine synthase [Oscillospiraceae bacterium]